MTGLKVPTVQIIAIGTELVLGRIQDTNSFWAFAAAHRVGRGSATDYGAPRCA